MTTFNEVQTIATMIEVCKGTDVSMAEQMQILELHFGEDVLLPSKMGGLNGNAFREGAKLETEMAAATACGMTLEDARSLNRIRVALNTFRPTLWQTYQAAHFGQERIKPRKKEAEPSEESLEMKAMKEDKDRLAGDKKDVAEKIKTAKARQTIAKLDGDTVGLEAATETIAILEPARDLINKDLKNITAEISKIRDTKKSETLRDKVQILIGILSRQKDGVELLKLPLAKILESV